MIIKDSMVLIHLAKISLLEKTCDYFKNVLIPEEVYNEVLAGVVKKYPDVNIITNLVDKNKINIKKVKNKELLKKANEFNIQKGEARAVALYWQEKADYLATDDDNVRKKALLLDLKLIGTPSIILKLYKKKVIDWEKFKDGLDKLREIGWFSDMVIDKLLMEGSK